MRRQDALGIASLLWWILAAQLWAMGSPLAIGPIVGGAMSAVLCILAEIEDGRSWKQK